MSTQLVSLTFNHDPVSDRQSALNIRIDGTQTVQIPEWVAGRSSQSPAAYAIEETATSVVSIEGRFSGEPNSIVTIKAVPFLNGDFDLFGQIGPLNIIFDTNGNSGPVRLPLLNASFLFAGVARNDVRLIWSERKQQFDPWTTFAETAHVIFTVLRTPTSPWIQHPFSRGNTQLPWADVLQTACTWARGTFDARTAAGQITMALFALGGERLRYSCLAGAPSNYSFQGFDCSAFLERLAGGFGRGPSVNCSDCATIVSTFANAVGCDLSQSRMFNPVTPFGANPLQLIGQQTFGPVCGLGVFNYHEVAWSGLCTEFEDVFDACIAVAAPAAPLFPLITLVPANLRFGWPNQGLYRDLIAAPGSRSVCQAQPTARQRRLVF
jgi:hypothetical protein